MTSQIRFVLCETTHPGNIGAAARAMKTMGFEELVLVNPRHFPSLEADARASGALSVLTSARVVDDLAEAVADCGLVVATSARQRRANRPEYEPRDYAPEIVRSSAAAPVAVVFGTESAGLTNAQLDLCRAQLCIPTNPDYTSLNLGSAVQLIAYELLCARAVASPPVPPEFPPASSGDMQHFYAHLERVLIQTGFLKPDKPSQIRRKLRLIFDRAAPDEHELNILRGVLSAVEPDEADANGGKDKQAL